MYNKFAYYLFSSSATTIPIQKYDDKRMKVGIKSVLT